MRLHPFFETLLAVFAVLATSEAQNSTRPLIFCTKDSLPMSQCTPGGDSSTFSGYELELFRRAMQRLGLEENKDYLFKCASIDKEKDITEILVSSFGQRECDAFGGAVVMTTERKNKGIAFSNPTYRSSLAILVRSKIESPDGWFFVKPFDWSVWLAIGLTLLVFPFFAYLVESLSLKGRIRHQDWQSGLRKSYWELAWVSMQNGSSSVESSATRIMLLAYGALAVVLLTCYVANLTSSLTIRRFQASITSIDELRGKACGSVKVYEDRLGRNGVLSKRYPTQSVKELGQGGPDDWLTQLRTGSLVAFVYSEPLLRYINYYTSNTTGCDLRVLEQTFEPFDYAFAFPNTTTMDLKRLDDIMLTLQEDSTVASLIDRFMKFQPKCQIDGSSESFSISFSQVWGVWVLFGGCVVIGIIVAAFLIPRRRRTMRRRQTANSTQINVLGEPSLPLSEMSFTTNLNALPVQLAGQGSMDAAKV